MDLPANEKIFLLALAEHADHDGNNAYPGLELLIAKTGYSERNVRRILRSLESRGVITSTNEGGGFRNYDTYSIDTCRVDPSPYFLKRKAHEYDKLCGQIEQSPDKEEPSMRAKSFRKAN